jgi:hypothetical protein
LHQGLMLSSAGFGQIGAFAKLRERPRCGIDLHSGLVALHVAGDGIDRKGAKT